LVWGHGLHMVALQSPVGILDAHVPLQDGVLAAFSMIPIGSLAAKLTRYDA